jgi:capsid protein
MIMNIPAGRSVEVVQPPSVREYGDYSKTLLRGIATGLRVTYEDITGDYTDLSFSAARMSRLRRWAAVGNDRWQLLIPQFCDPAWKWAMTAAQIAGKIGSEAPGAVWTAPPMPMIEPDKEGLAYQRNVRSGIMTLSEAVRERGYDPDQLFAEMAEDNKKLDKLGLILDSDARQMTQAGQLQGKALPAGTAQPTASTNGNGAGRTVDIDASFRRVDALIERLNSRLTRRERDFQD